MEIKKEDLIKIRKDFEEYTSMYGPKSSDFWKGWLAGCKYIQMNRYKELEIFLEELNIDYNKSYKTESKEAK